MTNELYLKRDDVLNLFEEYQSQSKLGGYVYDFGEALKDLKFRTLESQQRWIPVSEQYPTIGQDVLISKGDFVLIDTFCYDSIDETYYFYDHDDVEAWLPLPKPYKEGEEK